MRARRLLAAASLAALCAAAEPAFAFCRTTTCGPEECTSDPACEYCLVGGLPIYWPGGCVSFSVHDVGSPKLGIDPAIVRSLVSDAASIWIGVDCGGGSRPGLAVYDTGFSTCGLPDFQQAAPNANVWMFRDDTWPHAYSQLALTTVTFGIDTGKLYDADVEINSAENQITVGDTNIVWDLQSIIVHETGHFFGLAHSCVAGATMVPTFDTGQTGLRTLEGDDALAICSVYPPGSGDSTCDPTPLNGLATGCGTAGTGNVGGGNPGGSNSGGGGNYAQNEQPAAKGCSCGVPVGERENAPLWAAALLAAFAARRRRRNVR